MSLKTRIASEASRALAHGVFVYAKRQDAPIGSVAYIQHDEAWNGFKATHPHLVELAIQYQQTMFDQCFLEGIRV